MNESGKRRMTGIENGTLIKRVMAGTRILIKHKIVQRKARGVRREKTGKTSDTEKIEILVRRGGIVGAEAKRGSNERARALAKMHVGEAGAKKSQTDTKRNQTSIAGAVVEIRQTVWKNPERGNAAQAGRDHVNEAKVRTGVISASMKVKIMTAIVLSLMKNREAKMRLSDILLNGSH